MMKVYLRKLVSNVAVAVILILLGLFLSKEKLVSAETGLEDAVSFELGDEVVDSLSEKTEEDWYTFSTSATESGVDSWFKVVQLYSNKKENGYPPSVYLYDEKEKLLAHVSPSSENEEEIEYVLLEQERIYYVKVASEYHNDTADYRFSITELGDEAGENLEKAVDLEKNMTNRFELQSFDDEDWYFMETNISKPSLTVKNANVFSLRVGVYDIDGIQLDEFGVDCSKSETVKLNLADKNFYLRIYTEYSTEECIGSYTISVNDQVKVTKVSLNKSKVELKTGKSITLKATVSPDTATDKSVQWKSSDTKIATVDKNGKVVAKKAGTVTITCIANDGSKMKTTCKITVK